MSRTRRMRQCLALCMLAVCIASTGQAEALAPLNIEEKGGVDLEGLPNFGTQLVQMLLVLGGMVAVLAVLAKLLPRWLAPKGSNHGDGLIEIIERRQIEPKKSLLLVRVAGRFHLIGLTEGGMTSLAGGDLDEDALRSMLDEGPEQASFAQR
ncbi:MAG: flagellar biogenesis protein FliO, partial [Planctomycetota bacterium]